MLNLRAILVDDEPLALERLERMLQPYAAAVEIVGRAGDGAEAVTIINRLRPELIFLDVQMPGASGFEVLEELEYIPLVIFTTAFDQYALKAFDVCSVDYLLKPIDPTRLKVAIDKLMHLAAAGGGQVQQAGMREAQITLQEPHRRRIQVKTGDRIKLIPVADILYFRASAKYVEVHTIGGGSHLITDSLSSLELELSPSEFTRVHRSIIVNIGAIDEIGRTLDGGYELRLKSEARTRLPVSRRYRARLDLA
ncbi:MAG: response regulator [bacterium]|nr:response regulator [bacterium]